MKKQRKPLKRTPLKRGTKKLSTKTPIKKRSKKRDELYEERRPFVQMMLAARPWCEACPKFAQFDGKMTYKRNPSVDVHELVRRSQGGSIVDAENCITVCRPCHRRIGENPQLAFDLGLARRGHEKR